MVVRMTAHNGGALIQPAQFLGERFGAYRAACTEGGARWSKDQRGNVCAAEAVPRVSAALREAGFEVVIAEALATILGAVAEEKKAAATTAGELARVAVERAAAHGLTLFPFQAEGIGWLAQRRSAILADEMGLGKTIQALASLPEGAAVVVVAPAIALGVWKREAEKWRPDLRVTVLRGRGSWRWPLAGEIVVLNYEILPDDAGDAKRPTVVIADEAHALKSSKAQRTQRFRAIAKTARLAGGRTWLLTGTPILNRPDELWSLLVAAALERESFGDWPSFCRAFGAVKGGFGMVWGRPRPGVEEKIRRVLLKRKRAEVLPQLPRKFHTSVEVEILPSARREIDAIEAALREKGIDLTAAIDEANLTANQSAAFEEIARLRRVLATAKIPALLETVEEFEAAGQPVVVFSAHVDPVEMVGRRPGWAVIRGGVSPEERTRIEDAFQRGELKGVALTVKAGGVAITLTRAASVIFADLEWTPALNAQAEDRVARIGQTRGVAVTRLVADHEIDRKVTALLAKKQALIEASVEAAAVVTVGRSDEAEQLEALAASGVTAEEMAKRVASGGERRAVKTRRRAKDAVEAWAGGALVTLAALDPDRASVINGVGFSKIDGGIGKSLAEQFAAAGVLTDAQWAAAVRLARKYRRQVGAPPELTDDSNDGTVRGEVA